MQVQQKKFSSELAIVLWLRSHSSEAWLKHRVAFSHSVAHSESILTTCCSLLALLDCSPNLFWVDRGSIVVGLHSCSTT
ncbi:hypothetical protein KIPB_011384 [Kipferlia bialata]|uniref:Uncharacterized protein n=1 Tax=Kipferlia bialata TaxID=797122 RepID=A0A9K3D523_9EUKA|nr:hypothetical protein KIPB_011384 [Kipferlia bialata]|eukprot:g11384.t1